MSEWSLYRRLAPIRPTGNLRRGFHAEIADPVWFLGRQWQLGEHQGEDASSPVEVRLEVSHQRLVYPGRRPDLDPTVVPAEAIVEAETDDWWTLGRRIRLGRASAAQLAALAQPLSAPQRRALSFGALPAPYDSLANELDGRKVFRSGFLPGHALWSEVPAPLEDRWRTDRLSYNAEFAAGTASLDLTAHGGGDVDWYSVDGQPDAWWTLERRIELGQRAETRLGARNPPLTPAERTVLELENLPTSHQVFAGGLDGRKVFNSSLLPGDPIWQEVPVPKVRKEAVVSSRLRYPGAPHPRWWQIEDHAVDIGGFPPDRTHVATLFLLDIVLAHSDDWFTFVVPPPRDSGGEPGAGVLVTLHSTIVRDSFDDLWPLEAPPGTDDPRPPGVRPWSLFRTRGLSPTSLLVWPTVTAPLGSEPLDEVILGVDEDANLLWAVELQAEGLPLAPDTRSARALSEVTPTGTRRFRYLPSSTLPPHWHPYRIETEGPLGTSRRQFVQGLVADLTRQLAPPRAGPQSRLIGGPSGGGIGGGHVLEPSAVPSTGLRLARRWMLGRRTDGGPVLWVERSRSPIAAPPVSHLRFDVFAEAPADGGEPDA